MRERNPSIEFANKTALAYSAVCKLLCTEKAQPIIQRGRALHEAFFDRLLNGIDEARLNVFYGTLEQMGRNLDELLEGEL